MAFVRSAVGGGVVRFLILPFFLSVISAGAIASSSGSQLVADNWAQAQLSLELRGGSAEGLELNENYRLVAVAAEKGALYLAIEEPNDQVSLVRVEEQPVEDGGSYFYLYPGGNELLTASEPLGRRRATAVLFSKDPGLEPASGSSEQIAMTIRSAADKAKVASAETSFLIDVPAEDVQFTTRAILRALDEGQDETTPVRAMFPVNINFEYDSAQLTPEGIVQLDAFGAAMTDPGGQKYPVILAGHTDDIGSDEYNMQLSQQRAKAAKDYLVDNFDLTPDRIGIEAYGEDKPLFIDSSEQSRSKNRRVEFIFLKQ